MPAKKIYDGFIFHNELDLLRLRLEELYHAVDFFVLCEAPVTFRGHSKPLHYQEHKQDFAQYADKIIHIVVDDMAPQTEDASNLPVGDYDPAVWAREHFQRNAIRRGLTGAGADDVVIISDLDEIIRPEAVAYLRENAGYFLFDMAMYQFYLNMQAMPRGWRKPFAYTSKLSERIPDYNIPRTQEIAFYESFKGENHYIGNGGWHFTFLGGKQRVQEKLSAYSHTDGWQRTLWDPSVLDDQMVALREVGGTKPLRFCLIDQTFPKSVREQLPRYEALGYLKTGLARLQELEQLWGVADMHRREAANLMAVAIDRGDFFREIVRDYHPDMADLINLIPSSRDFSPFWNQGMQSTGAAIDSAITPPSPDNVVMRHVRDPNELTADTNVGYYSHLPVLAGRCYTASCHVWLPAETALHAVELWLDNWPAQQRTGADLSIRDGWQLIFATATAPPQALGGNVVLRAQGSGATGFLSTCWQFEEGSAATAYRATSRPIERRRSGA